MAAQEFFEDMILNIKLKKLTQEEREECITLFANFSNDVKKKIDTLNSKYKNHINTILLLRLIPFIFSETLNCCVLELYSIAKEFLKCIQNGIGMLLKKCRGKLRKRILAKGNYCNLFGRFDKFFDHLDDLPPYNFGHQGYFLMLAERKKVPILLDVDKLGYFKEYI